VLTAHVATGTNYTGADGVAQSSIVISQGAASTPSISNMPAPLTGAVGGGFTATVSTTGDGTKTVTSSTSSVCTTSGLVVTYVGPGSCVLTAHVATGTNYTGADGVAQSSIVISQGFVAPPTGPTNAPPPTNPSVPASSFGTPTSVTASCAATTTVSETSGGANETITVPQCALPSGTTLSAYPVINTAPLVAQVPAGSSYVLSFAVTWEAPNGTSPTATAPITMTITDLSIVAGDTIYELTSTGLVAVGTATANGTVTITFSSDPTFLVSHTTPVAQAPLRITTLSGTVGTALTLATRGGSGSGAVSFTVTNGSATGCRITGSSLTATGAGTCLVTATKAAVATYLAASSSATTVTFTAKVIPVHLHATRVHHYARIGRTVTLTIVGTGFYGKPTITSNEAGTRAVVTHDSGKLLTVRVTVRAGSPKGKHTFTIRLANGKSCRIYYLVK
jgi:ABC-type cobalt transport system substrate-binding protein